MQERTGSAKIVDNYDLFCEGDFEPHLGKTIHTLIFKTTDFIVYLDEDLFVEWAFTPSYDTKWSPDTARVLNRVSQVQAFPLSHLSCEQLSTFRQLVGEAVARLLKEHDPKTANEALDNAVQWVEGRNREIGRWWYLTASSTAAGVAALLILLLWLLRVQVSSVVGAGAFETAMGAGAGAVGAFLFILGRSKELSFDPAASRRIHSFEGVARVLAGTVGALIVALGARANLVLGGAFAASDHRLALLLAACMIAGASERFVPSLIEKVESTAMTGPRSDHSKKSATDQSAQKRSSPAHGNQSHPS